LEWPEDSAEAYLGEYTRNQVLLVPLARPPSLAAQALRAGGGDMDETNFIKTFEITVCHFYNLRTLLCYSTWTFGHVR